MTGRNTFARSYLGTNVNNNAIQKGTMIGADEDGRATLSYGQDLIQDGIGLTNIGGMLTIACV